MLATRQNVEKMTALTKVREASGASVHGSLAVLPELVVDAVGSRDIVESPEILWVRNPAYRS